MLKVDGEEFKEYLLPLLESIYGDECINGMALSNITTDGEYIYCDIKIEYHFDSVQIPIRKYKQHLRKKKINKLLNG